MEYIIVDIDKGMSLPTATGSINLPHIVKGPDHLQKNLFLKNHKYHAMPKNQNQN